jgi:hypothetical protein
VVIVFLILLPMAVAAWIRVGPVAGVIAAAWLVLVAYIRTHSHG